MKILVKVKPSELSERSEMKILSTTQQQKYRYWGIKSQMKIQVSKRVFFSFSFFTILNIAPWKN